MGIGTESKKRPQHAVCNGPDEASRGLIMEKRKKSEDLKLTCLLTCFSGQTQLVCSQGIPAGVGGWNDRMNKEEGWKKIHACSVGNGGQRSWGGCSKCSATELGGMGWVDLEENRER